MFVQGLKALLSYSLSPCRHIVLFFDYPQREILPNLMSSIPDPDVGTFWPPKDPMKEANPHVPNNANRNQEKFTLPDSPWTFGTDGFNPRLAPSNTARRRTAMYTDQDPDGELINVFGTPVKTVAPISAVPPYHPSYGSSVLVEGRDSASSSSSPVRNDSDDSEGFGPGASLLEPAGKVHVRRGSEGWEARPLVAGGSRWDVEGWRDDIPSADPTDKYRRYVPEEDSSELEEDEQEEDDWEKE